MPKFGIIINPRARRMRKKGAIDRIRTLTKGYDVAIEIPDISTTPSPETYKRPLENLLEKHIDALLVCSGDGGHHLIDTVLYGDFQVTIPQANLRGGTINVRADSAGLPRRGVLDIARYTTVEHSLMQILEAYDTADKKEIRTVERKLLSVSTDTTTYYGFSYSDGLLPKVYEEFYALGGHHIHTLGLLARFLTSFPFTDGFAEQLFEPVHTHLLIKNQQLSEDYLGFLVLSQDVRMDFGPIELGSTQIQGINDAQDLRCLRLREGTKWDLLCELPNIVTLRGLPARSITHTYFEQYDTDDVIISPMKHHKFFIDGDIYTTQTEEPIIIEKVAHVPYLTL